MPKQTFEIRSVFLVMALVLLGSIGVAFWSSEASQALNARIRSHNAVVGLLERLLSAMKDAETGQRGFLLTGKDSYLEPYNKSLAKVSTDLTEVRKLALGKLLPEADVNIVVQQAGVKMNELAETAATRRQAGLEKALMRVNDDVGKNAFDKVRAAVQRLEEPEKQRLTVATHEARRAGGIRDVILLAALFVNLGFLLWAYRKIMRGITLRDEATEQIRRQGEVLATTLASIGDAVIIADNSTNITFLNAVAEDLTGWKSGEAMGRPCSSVFQIINETSREMVESPVDKVLQTGVIVGLANHTLLIRKDGSEVPIDDSGAPIREPDGTVLGVVLVFRDFSAYKESERNMTRARDELQRASKAKDLFLAALSHELRTPLAPVLAILSEWDEQAGFPGPLKADLTMIRRNVALEARLIDDLLDLARIDRGMLAMTAEEVSMHELVEATLKMYESDIQAKSLRLQLDLTATKPNVMGDPARLQQVLWNILGNALKFTPAHGALEVKTFHPTADSIVVRVTDSGIGISETTKKHLFSPFYQGNHEDGRKFGGLGLGMAISKALIDQHSGEITVESDGPGTGSTFAITLPVTLGAGVAPASLQPEEQGPPLRLHILLAEDHVDTARTLGTLLHRRGHTVELAGSVAEAVRIFQEQEFDIIVSDVGLPDGTGLDLIRQIRELSSLPAIALTGHGMREDIDHCLAAGFTSHLTKPVSIQQLLKEIARLASLQMK